MLFLCEYYDLYVDESYIIVGDVTWFPRRADAILRLLALRPLLGRREIGNVFARKSHDASVCVNVDNFAAGAAVEHVRGVVFSVG